MHALACYTCVCAPCVVSVVVWRGYLIPWNWSYSWSTSWVLGIESQSSGRIATTAEPPIQSLSSAPLSTAHNFSNPQSTHRRGFYKQILELPPRNLKFGTKVLAGFWNNSFIETFDQKKSLNYIMCVCTVCVCELNILEKFTIFFETGCLCGSLTVLEPILL